MHIGEVTTTGTTASVELTPDAGGTASADAVWFVKKGLGASKIGFILTDHLGTPTKIIDDQKAVAWSRTWTPFGITAGEFSNGTFATSVAFPGQVRDAEPALSYNYFRDYDPSLGRYIQSDPIGLGGGLNTYGYVGGNPFRYVDPLGLVIILDREQIQDTTEDAVEVLNYFRTLINNGCFFWDWGVAAIIAENSPQGRLPKLVSPLFKGGKKLYGKIKGWFKGSGKGKGPGGANSGGGGPKGGKPGDPDWKGNSPSKPLVEDPKLKNLADDLYSRGKGKVGSGSTADAIRKELATGKPVGGKWHTQKGQDYIKALQNWLKNNPNASQADRNAAQQLLDDLLDAFGGG